MKEQEYVDKLGGTMRLGAWECHLDRGSLAIKAYAEPHIFERHRHRYEFNNAYRDRLSKRGLKLSGYTPDEMLVEIIELDQRKHPWFLGCQFHPEFKSRPWAPHPLFREFIRAALNYRKSSRKPAPRKKAKP
jgi:CTP synthase